MKHLRNSRCMLAVEALETRNLLNYSLIDLGLLPTYAGSSWAADINESGQIVGALGGPALWTPATPNGPEGSLVDLGTMGTRIGGTAWAVNDRGEVTGWAWGATDAVPEAFLWTPDSPNGTSGAMVSLAPGVRAEGYDINNAGDTIVGYFVPNTEARAFVWEKNVGLTDLNSLHQDPGLVLTHARALNDNHMIVADGILNGKYVGYLLIDDDGDWSGGGATLINLGDFGETKRGNRATQVEDINNAGQIVGQSLVGKPTRTDYYQAFVITPDDTDNNGIPDTWYQGSNGANDLMLPIGTIGKDLGSEAYGINEDGVVVGQSIESLGRLGRAFLWENGMLTDLNAKGAAGTDWTLTEARAVNGAGQIAGRGVSPHVPETPYDNEFRYQHGFLLTAPTALPQITIDDVAIAEGDSGTVDAVLTVTLSAPAPAGSTITVNYQTLARGYGAVEGVDFIGTSGSLSFSGDTTSQTVTVQVIGDIAAGATDGFNEIVFVQLSDAQGAVFLDSQGTVTILEDEPVLSIGDVQMQEGNSGTTSFVFSVTLDQPAKADVTVEWYTEGNSAQAGQDFVDVPYTNPKTLTILAGQTTPIEPLIVEVIGDTDVESDEVFYVWLNKSTLNNAWIPAIEGRPSHRARADILDDDGSGGGKKGGGGGKGGGPKKSLVTSTDTDAKQSYPSIQSDAWEAMLFALVKAGEK